MSNDHKSSDTRIVLTVVIPAYNYAHYLKRAAVSVIEQLQEYAELIIIDDGSKDNTPEVITQLQEEHPGSFRAIRQPNAGLAAVRNKGLQLARGSYLVFLDADDELLPGALTALYAHITEQPESQMILAGHISVQQDGRESRYIPLDLPASKFDRVRDYLITKRIRVANGACAMHRSVFDHGRYPEGFRNAEDIPVFAQAFAHCTCTCLKQPILRIYKHDDSMRHDVQSSLKVGEALITETFDSGRLPAEMEPIRQQFTAQRYLSLFRTCANIDKRQALTFYRQALAADWKAIFRLSYTRKVIRLYINKQNSAPRN